MKKLTAISVLLVGGVSFGGVIEYKGEFPQMDADAFAALTNRVAAGETLLVLSEKTPKEFSWRTDGPDRLLAWPKVLKLEKQQRNLVSWRKIGRGLVIVAPEGVDSPDFRANVDWHADLLKNHGFWYVGYSCDKPESPVIGITMRYAEKVLEPKRESSGGGYWANYDADRTRKLRPLFRLEGKVTAGDGSSRYYETIEQPFGDSLAIRNVGVIRNVVHGRAKLEARFVDFEKNFSVLVDSRELVFPSYLETFLPNDGEVAVCRGTADVTVGFRINDEPHYGKDFVKVTLFDPSNKPVFEKTLEASVGQTHYLAVPLPRDAEARSNWPLQFETTRENGQVVCDKRRLRLNDDRRYDFVDQDGMILKKAAQRAFRFGVDSSVTNFAGTKIVATWTFGESRAMTQVFAEQVRSARLAAGPLAPLAAQIALDRTSRDLASDRRAVKALAALAFVGGANAVDWDFSKCKTPLNPLGSYAADAQAELLALDPAFAASGQMVTSTDGSLYARVTEKTLLVVNVERFASHASTLKVPSFAGKTLLAPDGTSYAFDGKGALTLTLEPDAVLPLTLVANAELRTTLLVHPDEFTDRWIDRAAAIGLTSLEIHPTGGTNAATSLVALLADLETPAFRARIDRARKRGLEIGYEFHAAGWLLPRDLFGEHPEYFRMDRDGKRCRDINFCLSSAEGMDLVAKRAVELAGRLYGSSHRYFFWMDDVPDGVCHCEKCRGYSASDQQLLFVNRVLAELRKTIPDAQLCYLAYLGGINPPEKVTPSEGVFLEYAPIKRDPKRPLAVQKNADVAPLKALVAKFGARDARVLEYWFDNSLLSKWTKPPKRFVPPADVVREDLAYYRALGFSDLASFACFLGDDYERLWGEPDVSPFARGFHSSVGGFDRTDFTWTIGGGRFRFAFTVRDATVSPVRDFKTKRDLERGDRVEVFFCPTADMKTAYRCAEIDPLGRVLDYACTFPRQFDYDWSFKTLDCRAARTKDGYAVEGSVALDELRGLGIDPAHFWLGAFRADFDENENLVAWHSQLPPGPGEADFHRPCMVGEVKTAGYDIMWGNQN